MIHGHLFVTRSQRLKRFPKTFISSGAKFRNHGIRQLGPIDDVEVLKAVAKT
jgi:hypothetical protein